MKITYVIEIDEADFDAETRALFEKDEEVLGEPTPGRHLIAGLLAESRESFEKSGYIDQSFWRDGQMIVATDSHCRCSECCCGAMLGNSDTTCDLRPGHLGDHQAFAVRWNYDARDLPAGGNS